jgi:hypothetical protein
MPELATKADLLELRVGFSALQTELRAGFRELHACLEIQTLRLTIRFGVMLAVWVVVAAIILKRV